MHVEVDLRQVVYALSDALDLVGVDDFYHGKRVGVMASEMAQAMGLDENEQGDLYDAGLLHDCGVSSTAIHQNLVHNLEWAGAQEHCQRGHTLLSHFPPIAHLGDVVLHHHTRWSDLQRMDVPHTLALRSNLIYMVDRVDALSAPHYGPAFLDHKVSIRQVIASHADEMFATELVEAFMDASHADAFWMMLEPRHIQNYLGYMLHRGMPKELDYVGLHQMATLFSMVVDAKSPFTASHSIGVAKLARRLAELFDLPSDTRDKMEIAGLMHDLGKLQIPDDILEKQGPLDGHERNIMNRHSFETYQILRRIPGLDDVAHWAAYHHETLDGSGYPYGVRGVELPLEARIIAVADIFQALAQNRPYRAAMPPGEILDNLKERVKRGFLDAGVVAKVEGQLDDCWRAAIAETEKALTG